MYTFSEISMTRSPSLSELKELQLPGICEPLKVQIEALYICISISAVLQ